ncbi:MAG TPA: hypothetical protein VF735_21275 [Pyrinomonadaceae bacterium]
MRAAIKRDINNPPQPLAAEPKQGRLSFSLAHARFVSLLLLMLVLPVAASAYTVVMRGGRRIEIPESFIVTRATLTYEAAPGINVTLQLSTIDIPATERANNEAAGSLLARADRHEPPPPHASRGSAGGAAAAAPSPSAAPRRTITNRDLEASRRAREAGEAAYERRRAALGLPSLEEVRRRNQEEVQRLSEQSRISREEEAQAETYWRGRATELRTEFAVVDAQLNYLRNRLAERPSTPLLAGAYTVVSGAVPFFPYRPRVFPHTVNSFGTAGPRGPQVVGSIDFGGGSTRGRVLVNVPGPAANNFGRLPGFSGRPRVFVPPFGHYAVSYPYYDSSYDRTALFMRLHELESVRAGLEARWRLLEDEARRAGAPPGWLRP